MRGQAKEKSMAEQNKCKVKICGLMREEDILAVNRAHPDFAGVILSEGFRRTIPAERAGIFKKILSPEIPLAGVFVNDRPEWIAELLNNGTIDIAQLHGSESEKEIIFIKSMTGKPVWKVFKLRPGAAGSKNLPDTIFEEINNSPADMVLLDAGTGTGESFDWSICRNVKRPFILAGGLTPENVADAIVQTRPCAVDTSSGVETNGSKDEDKIFEFVKNARAAFGN